MNSLKVKPIRERGEIPFAHVGMSAPVVLRVQVLHLVLHLSFCYNNYKLKVFKVEIMP